MVHGGFLCGPWWFSLWFLVVYSVFVWFVPWFLVAFSVVPTGLFRGWCGLLPGSLSGSFPMKNRVCMCTVGAGVPADLRGCSLEISSVVRGQKEV